MDATASRRHTPAPRLVPTLEPLENRTLLAVTGASLPSIGILDDAANPVVRVFTNVGSFDLEIFRGAVPGSVTNFLVNVETGLFDDLLVDRSIPNTAVSFGTSRLDTRPGAPLGVATLAPTRFGHHGRGRGTLVDLRDPFLHPDPFTVSIFEGFGAFTPDAVSALAGLQINLPGVSRNPISSRFPTRHDISYESRVIGRVLPASRGIVETINALSTTTIELTADPFEFDLTDVPVLRPLGSALPGDGPLLRNDFVVVTDVEVIKLPGVNSFFSDRIFFPEGFAGSTISEFVPIVNPNAFPVTYRAIVHFETGDLRDLVIAESTIAPFARDGVTISRAPDPAASLVPAGVPYAIEIVSTAPIAANLSHYDFGAAVGESFTPTTDTVWTFPEAEMGRGLRDFLVWYNASSSDADITIEIFPLGGRPLDPIIVRTDAFRRGGLSLADVHGIPDGPFSVRLTATEPIVAALTRYDTRSDDPLGSIELGIPGANARRGALPSVRIADDAPGVITLFNPGSVAEATPIAQVQLFFNSETPGEFAFRNLLVAPGQTIRLDLADLRGDLREGFYAASFVSNTPVAVSAEQTIMGDRVALPFTGVGANHWLFADGFLDPARAGRDVFEHLSIFNLNSGPDALTRPAEVAVRFLFADGFVLERRFTLRPGHHLFLDLDAYAPLLAQGRDHARYYYGLEILSESNVIAAMRRFDLTLGAATPTGGFDTLGLPLGVQ